MPEYELDPRQREALALFARQEAVTSEDLAAVLGLVPKTARRLMHQWTQQGFLAIADPSKKSRSYKLAPEFENLL